MNVTQRFTLLVKCSLDAMLEKFEDPERALHQLVIDMEEELEAAKRAAARAMANEDRLRSRIALHEKDARDWEASAERALKKDDEGGAREMLSRAERAERQRERLATELDTQARETADIRESVGRMHDRVRKARGRLELLQAKMRQGEARVAINKVMTGAQRANLQSEFDRFSERIELDTAAERSYFEIEDGLTGEDLRRRSEDAAIEESVEERLERMREKES